MMKPELVAVKQVWRGGRIAFETTEGTASRDVHELSHEDLHAMLVWQQEEIDRLKEQVDQFDQYLAQGI